MPTNKIDAILKAFHDADMPADRADVETFLENLDDLGFAVVEA